MPWQGRTKPERRQMVHIRRSRTATIGPAEDFATAQSLDRPPSLPTVHDRVRQAIERIERTMPAAQIVNSAGSAWVSFLAYQEFLSGTSLSSSISVFTAGVMGVCCGTSLHVLFRLTGEGVPSIGRKFRRGILPYVVGGALMAAGFSTYTNVVVTAGDGALEQHELSSSHALEAANAATQGAAFSIGQIGPGLRGQAEMLASDALCERQAGCKTGVPGRGDLTDALESAAGIVATAANTVTTAESRIAALVPQIREALETGDAQKARDLLTEMHATLPLDSLRQTATALRRDLGIEGTAANPDTRRRQSEVIAQTQQDLTAIADGIDAALERIVTESEGIGVPIADHMSKAAAILRYWDHLIPQIALGLALDWTLIFAALFLAKLRDALPPEESGGSDLTADQIQRSLRELDRLYADADEFRNRGNGTEAKHRHRGGRSRRRAK